MIYDDETMWKSESSHVNTSQYHVVPILFHAIRAKKLKIIYKMMGDFTFWLRLLPNLLAERKLS